VSPLFGVLSPNLAVWLGVLSSLGFLVGIGITWWLHSQYRLDVVASPDPAFDAHSPDLPLISVIVPARNEARNIHSCITALLAQTYPQFELLVVDDRSTDDTKHILDEIEASQKDGASCLSLQVIQGAELPPGWAGKPHALAQGAARAHGSWLCFIDADTFAAPGLLAAAYCCAQANGADLFSLMTRQELGSFWEKVIQPLVFTALSVGFSPRRVNDPRFPDAVANGQFILVRRQVYDAVGGYAAIRDDIVEDRAMATLVKRSGFRLLVADGRLVARTRMYTRFSEIWEGWTKNIYLGLRDRLWLLLLGVLVGMLGALVLPFWLLAGIAWIVNTGSVLSIIVSLQALLVWGVLLYARMQVSRAFAISPLYAFTLPLGALVFTAMMFASAFKVVTRRGVTWKGRRYLA